MISDHYKASEALFDVAFERWYDADGVIKPKVKAFFREQTITLLEKQIEWLKGEGFANPSEAGQFALHADGMNQAFDDTISYLQSEIEAIKSL